jgi:hypothetical protein
MKEITEILIWVFIVFLFLMCLAAARIIWVMIKYELNPQRLARVWPVKVFFTGKYVIKTYRKLRKSFPHYEHSMIIDALRFQGYSISPGEAEELRTRHELEVGSCGEGVSL